MQSTAPLKTKSFNELHGEDEKNQEVETSNE